MNNSKKVTKNGWVNKNFHKKNQSFYENGIIIGCLDQIRLDALQEYNVNEYLVFCEDINIVFYTRQKNNHFGISNLNYSDKVCQYCSVTNNPGEAEQCIPQLLDDGERVVFQTAMDYLKTNIWYHSDAPYTKTQHWSTLVGYNQQYYFILDDPDVRNPQNFKPHSKNSSVGLLFKEELHQAFKIHCDVGYMKVNLECIPTINEIITSIVQNFYFENNKKIPIYIGKQALEILIEKLNDNLDVKKIDIFGLRVLASRYDILKMNLIQCDLFSKKKDISINLLTELANDWRTIEYLRIKNEMSCKENIGKKIANVIEKNILPMMENLMYCFEMNF